MIRESRNNNANSPSLFLFGHGILRVDLIERGGLPKNGFQQYIKPIAGFVIFLIEGNIRQLILKVKSQIKSLNRTPKSSTGISSCRAGAA